MQDSNIIKCPKCSSDRVKKLENENDFLHVKPEGEPARKQKNNINQNIYYCLNCGYEWDINKIGG
jgi:DNA-directed RNA polymerase subunit RPC12/RpoP